MKMIWRDLKITENTEWNEWLVKHHDLQKFGLKLNIVSNVHELEVVGRGSAWKFKLH